MVQTAKPDEIINTINESIANNITKSIQDNQDSVYQTQIVNIVCDTDAINIIENGINDCRVKLKAKGKSNDLINKYCKSILNCKGSNISLSSSLNITNITQQTIAITQTVQNSITNDITQRLNAMDNILDTLLNQDAIKTEIDNINKEVSNNLADILQQVQNQVTQNQDITLTNYSANNITITSVSNIILNSIQNISSVQSIVQNLSNQISQTLDQKPKSLADIVINIGSIVLAIIAVIFVIVGLLKSKDTRELLDKYSPYILFIIGSLLIVWLHKIFKPSYILIDKNADAKTIDNNRLLLYCSIYIIGLGVSEIIFYKYIKSKH